MLDFIFYITLGSTAIICLLILLVVADTRVRLFNKKCPLCEQRDRFELKESKIGKLFVIYTFICNECGYTFKYIDFRRRRQ